MFLSLADLSGKSTKAMLGNWAGGCDQAITDAVKSGNSELFKQAVADWAKSGQLGRATAATPAEVAAYFSRGDIGPFATTMWNNVTAGQSPNVMGQQWPQPVFNVQDPNTPGISKCGETFKGPAPAAAPPPPAATVFSPPSAAPAPVYAPPPAYAPAPVAAPPPYQSQYQQPQYAPPPPPPQYAPQYQQPQYQPSYQDAALPAPAPAPAPDNKMMYAAVAGGALLIGAVLLLKKSKGPQYPQGPYGPPAPYGPPPGYPPQGAPPPFQDQMLRNRRLR